MAKDPAFLFYPGDWVSGTMYLTFEQKGAYFELLMLQFNIGRFTIQNIEHVLNVYYSKVWPIIKGKFKTDGTYYWNERLEFEKEKRKSFCNSRKENKIKSYDKTCDTSYDETSDEHMIHHMENENIYIKEDVLLNGEIVFKKIKHLSITKSEYEKLLSTGYTEENINDFFISIENYKKITSYTSLYLTALKWLKKDHPQVTEQKVVSATEAELDKLFRAPNRPVDMGAFK